MHSMAPEKNLFLSVKRQVVAVFAHQNLSQQSGPRQAAVQQSLRQRCDQRPGILHRAMNVFATDEPSAQEPARFVIELFADFLADQAPGLGLLLHRLGINNLFDDRQLFGQTRRSIRSRVLP